MYSKCPTFFTAFTGMDQELRSNRRSYRECDYMQSTFPAVGSIINTNNFMSFAIVFAMFLYLTHCVCFFN